MHRAIAGGCPIPAAGRHNGERGGLRDHHRRIVARKSAEARAFELGVPLFRVELASVVYKYIGETEKNLEEVFRAVENDGGVLLLDEADVLFGKRSDVSDSRDGYANIEVANLLQRIEQ
jgi:SpoVK/Ycf46/Vps4 family AAA+-type ATPase